MDINFKLEDKVFNYRVAAIIKNNDKYLVMVHTKKDYVSLIGGRVKIGETSTLAITREVLEETGYEVIHKKVLGMVENFFVSDYDGKWYHEILIVHELVFKLDLPLHKDFMLDLEGKIDGFRWFTKEELLQKHLKPSIILDYLDSDEFFHIIYKE